MPDQTPPLWTRGYVLACLANILIFFNVHLLLSTVAGYVVARFAVGDAMGGTAAAVFIIGTVVARLLAGPLIERFGPRVLLLIAFAAFVVAPLLYWASGSVWMLLAVRTLHGMTFGVGSTVIAGAAVSRIPRTRMAEGTTHYSSSTLIGVATGPVVGLALAGVDTGFGPIAVTASLASAAGLAVAFILPPVSGPRAATGPSSGDAVPGQEAPRPRWARFVEPGALPSAVMGTLYSIGYAAIVTFLATLAAERGFGAAGSAFFLVYAGTVLISRLVTGRLMDRASPNVVMVPGFVIFAAALALLAVAQSWPVLLGSAVLLALGYGQLQSAGQTISVIQVPAARAGMGASTYFLGIDVGMGLGPILAGVLAQWLGVGPMYLVLAVFVLALLPVYWLAQGRQLRRPPDPAPTDTTSEST